VRDKRRDPISVSSLDCFEHAPIGFSVTDMDGRLLEVNPAYCLITGYSEAELLSSCDMEALTHPDDLARNLEEIDALVAGATPAVVLEKRYVQKGGEIVWARDSVSMVCDENGRPQNLIRLTQDITARKLAEASLREIQLRNETILASVSDVHILFDREWRYVYVNEAAWQAINRPPEEILGHTLWEAHPDIVGTELERQYRRAMEEKIPVSFEYHYVTFNTWWENRFHPTADGLAVFATNITDRKHAEESLRRSEKELAEAQQLATLGSWSWDINTGLVTWSDELYRIFGLHPQQFRASFEAIIERVHPEDRYSVLRELDRCIKSHERYNQPNRIVRPDGTVRRLEVVGSVVPDAQGSPVRMVGFCRDVTELENTKEARRTAERKYRQIFENAGEGIFQSTPEGCYITANPALAHMHGFDSPEELIRSCRDISHQIYAHPEQREEFKRLLDLHGVVRGYEHESLRKDGSKIWISVNARAVTDQTGKILYYEGTTQDITERKRAQEESRTYSRRLMEAQESERRRISRELHDQVGQILTAVKMNLYSLHQECSAPEILSSIEDNMKVIDEAVDQVRHLSVDLRPPLLDDFGLVIALRWYLDRQAKHGGVPAEFLSRSFDEDQRLSSELETACFRVVQEAVTNVVRHARATRISVLLETTGSDLILLITDNGKGFDVNGLRNSPARTATLGLLGMEERVQAVGGTITIDSVAELGTEICARFPIDPTTRAFSHPQISQIYAD
jgi:PAS domain S-box-containing protein